MMVCLPYQMNELTGPCSAFHRSTGKPSREMVYPIVQFALVLLTVSIGFALFGKSVLAIVGAVAISMVASALVYMAYTNRFLEVRLSEFAWKVLAPGIAPYAFGFLLAWVTHSWFALLGGNRWKTLGLLGACGLVYTPVAIALLYRFMCDWGEREYLRKQLKHTLGGLLRFGRSKGETIKAKEVEAV
jgi:hypothetical protein